MVGGGEICVVLFKGHIVYRVVGGGEGVVLFKGHIVYRVWWVVEKVSSLCGAV